MAMTTEFDGRAAGTNVAGTLLDRAGTVVRAVTAAIVRAQTARAERVLANARRGIYTW
jgi:hypothetical protein